MANDDVRDIISILFDALGMRKYIGMRYVPIFGRLGETSMDWDNTKPYEQLTVVLHNGNSYTSKQFVPIGVDITNTDFWALSGNYNAQVEEYKQAADSAAEEAHTATENVERLESLLPDTEFTSENTVKNYVDNITSTINENVSNINDIIPSINFTSNNTVKDYIDNSITEYDASNIIKNINVETVGNLFVPENTYAQGATSNGTHIFVFYEAITNDTTSCIVKYDIANLTNYNIFTFTNYPNIGHGNSIEYDSVTDKIIIFSSNRYMTIMDTNLNVISHRNVGASSKLSAVSQLCMNQDYAIANITGTNTFHFYKRLTNELFGMYANGVYTLPRGMSNILQDCFMYNNSIISINSSSAYNVYLSVIGVNTNYLAIYKIKNLHKEIEGGFAINSMWYFVASDGTLYKTNAPSDFNHLNSQTSINASIDISFLRYINADNTKVKTYTTNNNLFIEETGSFTHTPTRSYNVWRIILNPSVPFYDMYNFPIEHCNVLTKNIGIIARVSAGDLRIPVNYYGRDVTIFYKISDNVQYLSAIEILYNDDRRYETFAADGSDFETKFNSLFDNTQSLYLPTPVNNATVSIQPYGLTKQVGHAYDFYMLLDMGE